jgi:hypothetical protein
MVHGVYPSAELPIQTSSLRVRFYFQDHTNFRVTQRVKNINLEPFIISLAERINQQLSSILRNEVLNYHASHNKGIICTANQEKWCLNKMSQGNPSV